MKHKSKNYLLDKFINYNKWKDLVNIKSLECQLSLILTILFILIIHLLKVYDGFEYFLEVFQNITINIASALIGLLGIILAGIAIIISLLNRDVIKEIEKINPNNSLERILVSFGFLIFITGLETCFFLFTHIILYSPSPLIPWFSFYLYFFTICYLFLFTIFYTISLSGNCIRFFIITKTYNEIIEKNKNIYILANEIRIDFILNEFISDVTKEEFLTKLNNFVDAYDDIDNDKEKLKKYFSDWYSSNEAND